MYPCNRPDHILEPVSCTGGKINVGILPFLRISFPQFQAGRKEKNINEKSHHNLKLKESWIYKMMGTNKQT